jgi:hypothetical protein
LLEQLDQLKRRRSLHDDEARIKLLDVAIERRALSELAARREALYRELETASLRVRTLTAQIRGASIFLREHSEKCGDPDVAQRLMAQIERWLAGSLPTCTPSVDDIQSARRQWLAQFSELMR